MPRRAAPLQPQGGAGSVPPLPLRRETVRIRRIRPGAQWADLL